MFCFIMEGPTLNHLLSLAEIPQQAFVHLLERSCAHAREPWPEHAPLARRCVGIEFRKTSTRTRTSFAVAAVRLGGQPIIFGPADLQTNTGESRSDTARVLGRYLDMLVIRTAADPTELRQMAQENQLPIINAMTADEHPTQALTDIALIKRRFGELTGLKLLYSGEGNNTAIALAYAASRCRGFEADFRTPPGYGIPEPVIRAANRLCEQFGGCIRHSHVPPGTAASHSVDVLYTTRWQTTGTSKADPVWRESFAPFSLDERLFAQLRRDDRSVFMHDLPAVRGEECSRALLDGPDSICFEQAGQKLFTAMAVLEWCTLR